MTHAPKISLCMICRDEERWIAQAISSVAAVVSEIIVVDTGSTDRTAEIARGLGAKILNHTWSDDFSVPRNLSLDAATGDWILVMDADEAVAREDLPALVALTRVPQHAFLFMQRHYTNDPRITGFQPAPKTYPEWERGYAGYFESGLTRLFPRDSRIRYRGRIHELVDHSIAELKEYRIARAPFPLHHYGHTPEVKAKKNKSGLYTPLGIAKRDEQPHDWKAYYELGVEHNVNGRLVQSIEAFQEAIRLNPHFLLAWVNLGYVLCESARYSEAAEVLQQAIARYPKSAEAYCNLGVVYLRMHRYSMAEQACRAALEIDPRYINCLCNLGKVLVNQNRLEEAGTIYLRAIELMPGCVEAKLDLGILLLLQRRFGDAEQHLNEVIACEPEKAVAFLHLGQALREQNRAAEAVAALERFSALARAQVTINPAEQEQILLAVQRECERLRGQS